MRTNGFEFPLSPQQVLSWGIFMFDVVVFLCFCVHLLPSQMIQCTVGSLWGASVALMVAATVTTTKSDPLDPKVCGPDVESLGAYGHGDLLWCHLCSRFVLPLSKHCRGCNKCVHAFCHHDVWVNNCIGGSNYRSYVVALVSATTVTGISTITSAAIMVEYWAAPTEMHVHMSEAGSMFASAAPCIISIALLINLPLFLFALTWVGFFTFLSMQCLSLFDHARGRYTGVSWYRLQQLDVDTVKIYQSPSFHSTTFTSLQRSDAFLEVVDRMPVENSREKKWLRLNDGRGWVCTHDIQDRPVTAEASGISARRHEYARAQAASLAVSRSWVSRPGPGEPEDMAGQRSRRRCIPFIFHAALFPLHFAVISSVYAACIAVSTVAGLVIIVFSLVALVVKSVFFLADVCTCFTASDRIPNLPAETCLAFLYAAYIPLLALAVYMIEVVLLVYRLFMPVARWPQRHEAPSSTIPDINALREGSFTIRLSNLLSVGLLDFAVLRGSVASVKAVHWLMGVSPDAACLELAVTHCKAELAEVLLALRPELCKDQSLRVLAEVASERGRMALFRVLVLGSHGRFESSAGLRTELKRLVGSNKLRLTPKDLLHPKFLELGVRAGALALRRQVSATHLAQLQAFLADSGSERDRQALAHPDARVWCLVGAADGGGESGDAPLLSVCVWRQVPLGPRCSCCDKPQGMRAIQPLLLVELSPSFGGVFAGDLARQLQDRARRARFEWICAASPADAQESSIQARFCLRMVVSEAEVASRCIGGLAAWLRQCSPQLPDTVLRNIDSMIRSPFGNFRQHLLEQMALVDGAPLHAKRLIAEGNLGLQSSLDEESSLSGSLTGSDLEDSRSDFSTGPDNEDLFFATRLEL